MAMHTIPNEVLSFLTSNVIATIATLSKNGYPYTFPVFYIFDSDSHLYFASHKESQKIDNMILYPQVGISITDAEQLLTLQLQGTAKVMGPKMKNLSKTILRIFEVANANSNNVLPPIMKIGTGMMELVNFSIEHFRFSRYSEQDAVFVEGTLKDR